MSQFYRLHTAGCSCPPTAPHHNVLFPGGIVEALEHHAAVGNHVWRNGDGIVHLLVNNGEEFPDTHLIFTPWIPHPTFELETVPSRLTWASENLDFDSSFEVSVQLEKGDYFNLSEFFHQPFDVEDILEILEDPAVYNVIESRNPTILLLTSGSTGNRFKITERKNS